MADEPKDPPAPDRLTHRTLDYARPHGIGPGPVMAVVLFGTGLVLAFPAMGTLSLPIMAIFNKLDGRGVILAPTILLGAIIVSLVKLARLHRHDPSAYFAMGFLCGTCLTFLLEGICFGSLALSK